MPSPFPGMNPYIERASVWHAGPDREQYLAKARQLQRSRVHFVEIDLLRGGPRTPWLDTPQCDYCAVASRVHAGRGRRSGRSSRECLPEIPIPLRAGRGGRRP